MILGLSQSLKSAEILAREAGHYRMCITPEMNAFGQHSKDVLVHKACRRPTKTRRSLGQRCRSHEGPRNIQNASSLLTFCLSDYYVFELCFCALTLEDARIGRTKARVFGVCTG